MKVWSVDLTGPISSSIKRRCHAYFNRTCPLSSMATFSVFANSEFVSTATLQLPGPLRMTRFSPVLFEALVSLVQVPPKGVIRWVSPASLTPMDWLTCRHVRSTNRSQGQHATARGRATRGERGGERGMSWTVSERVRENGCQAPRATRGQAKPNKWRPTTSTRMLVTATCDNYFLLTLK